MKSRFFWIAALLLLQWFQTKAQSPLDASFADYSEAVKSVKVIQNKNNLLPIKDLDKKRFAFFSSAHNSEMGRALALYAEVLFLKKDKNLKDIDILIVEVSNSNDYVYLKEFLVKDVRVIAFLTKKLPPVLMKKVDAILLSENKTSLTEHIAAQIIFGGIGMDGQKAIRLGYAPPEAVGMNTTQLEDSIQSIINYGMEQKAYPGAQVLVAKNGKIIYHKAFGYHTYDHKKPVKISDIYDMASVSKTTTSLPILMKWYGEKRFDLDATMSTYWPQFKGSNKENITWRNALAHNARLKPWIAYWTKTLRKHPRKNKWRYKWWTFKPKKSRRYPIKITDNLWLHKNYKKKIFKAIRKSPLNEKQEYKYSGLTFYLLPTMIEQMAKMDFETYLKQEFYKPLGANTLTYNPLRFYKKDRIIPTERDTFFRMEQIHGTVHDEGAMMMGGVSSNAGLFGTANDMAKLWQMYLNKGTYGGKVFITKEAVEEFTKCQFCPQGNHRGLGFDKPRIEFDPAKANYAKEASSEMFGHAGYTGTLIWADPANDLLFIFLSNRVYPTRNNRKLYSLDIRPRLHNAIFDSILDK